MSKFSTLAAICVASTMIFGSVFVSGEAQADDQAVKTISGDSGSVVDEAVAQTDKKLTRKEKRALRKKAKQNKAKIAKAENKKKKSGLICKREKVSGTHFRQKICRTQEEMDAQREHDQQMIRDINPSAAGGAPQS